MGKHSREELAPAVAAAVFGAPEGAIVGPLEMKREGEYLLLRVERQLPAVLDVATEAFIREQLVQDRLKQLELESEVDIALWDSLTG